LLPEDKVSIIEARTQERRRKEEEETTNKVTKIPYLLKTSRQSLFVIKQKLLGTLSVDGLGFILAFVGLINPLLAATEVMVQDLVEYYVSQTRNEVGMKVAIELKDTVANIF
jgi:hypothetical protein